MSDRSSGPDWIPLLALVPSAVPTVLGDALADYRAAGLAPGERRLNDEEVRTVLLAASAVAALMAAHRMPLYRYTDARNEDASRPLGRSELDAAYGSIAAEIEASIATVECVGAEGRATAQRLFRMLPWPTVIPRGADVDEWLHGIFWPELMQSPAPPLPTALHTAVLYGMFVVLVAQPGRLVWDDECP